MAVMELTASFSIVNVVLLIVIATTHLKNFKAIRSSFTLGLLLFTTVFLIQNLFSTYHYITMMHYYAKGLEIPALFLTVLQTIAFAIFLHVTRD